jgi:flagellar basal-body rod protein FlgB
MLGDENTVALLSKMMELSTKRQKVIANNLANANTPGYTRRELDFEAELKGLLEQNDFGGLHDLKGKLVLDESNHARLDGNNVSVTQEMNEMSQNGVLFSLMQRALTTKMNIIKSAIK